MRLRAAWITSFEECRTSDRSRAFDVYLPIATIRAGEAPTRSIRSSRCRRSSKRRCRSISTGPHACASTRSNTRPTVAAGRHVRGRRLCRRGSARRPRVPRRTGTRPPRQRPGHPARGVRLRRSCSAPRVTGFAATDRSGDGARVELMGDPTRSAPVARDWTFGSATSTSTRSRVAAMGFCFDGATSLQLLRRGRPDGRDRVRVPIPATPTYADAVHIRGRVLLFCGANDPLDRQGGRDGSKPR